MSHNLAINRHEQDDCAFISDYDYIYDIYEADGEYINLASL